MRITQAQYQRVHVVKPLRLLPIAACLLVAVSAGIADDTPAPAPVAGDDEILDTKTRVLDTSTLSGMQPLLDAIAERRLILVGESHDRYEDHLNQLAIIRGLHERGKALGIGMEMFQQPFQTSLDAYVAGAIDEGDFLRRTQYFDRWRYDYRLYRPILRFAREHRIPVIALNLAGEITAKVGEAGIDALSPEQRAAIPSEIDRDDPAYRERVRQVFDMHPMQQQRDFEHFLEVQLLWDEGMAERAAAWLAENPDKTLVVLAGVGHLEYGQGIPSRVLRRIEVPAATIIPGSQRALEPEAADFLLFPRRVELPAKGLLGVMLVQDGDGKGARVQGFSEGSGAEAAGMEQGDLIVKVGEHPVSGYADIRIALIGSRPGQRLPVAVLRKRVLGPDEQLSFEVELH